MANSVHFAHLTDIHISERKQSWSTVSTLAAELFTEAVRLLNQIDDLDFVMVTGDVLDTASRAEVSQFRDIIGALNKTWYFIPGNHDGFIDPNFPNALLPEQAVALIDPRMAEPTPYVQHGWWSRAIGPGVRLIGLDSRLAETWAGVVSQPQMDWLKGELDQHTNDLVILTVHHPLHALGEHNFRGRFPNFICSNGAEVEALLDHYPNVKLVLSGHHHANHISFSKGGKRLHVCTTALSGYQCIFRTIRLTPVDSGWHISVMTHSTATPQELQKAYEVAMADNMAREYNPDNPAAWVDFCAGRPEDLTFDGVLA
jgi:3',5'-cyclic-AMP phosphodiesterase